MWGDRQTVVDCSVVVESFIQTDMYTHKQHAVSQQTNNNNNNYNNTQKWTCSQSCCTVLLIMSGQVNACLLWRRWVSEEANREGGGEGAGGGGGGCAWSERADVRQIAELAAKRREGWVSHAAVRWGAVAAASCRPVWAGLPLLALHVLIKFSLVNATTSSRLLH